MAYPACEEYASNFPLLLACSCLGLWSDSLSPVSCQCFLLFQSAVRVVMVVRLRIRVASLTATATADLCVYFLASSPSSSKYVRVAHRDILCCISAQSVIIYLLRALVLLSNIPCIHVGSGCFSSLRSGAYSLHLLYLLSMLPSFVRLVSSAGCCYPLCF